MGVILPLRKYILVLSENRFIDGSFCKYICKEEQVEKGRGVL